MGKSTEGITKSEDDSDIIKTTMRISEANYWNLKQLALDRKTTVTMLANEAFNELLRKYQTSNPKMEVAAQ